MNLIEVKKLIHHKCMAIVEQRINSAKQAMDDAQESANQEEKSSAGDKYETGRAMAQIARDQAAQQLEEALKLKSALDKINPTAVLNKITSGSLVITDQSRFYISVSLGKLEMEGKECFAISPQSPIGKLLLTRSAGDTITFQNKNTRILEIA